MQNIGHGQAVRALEMQCAPLETDGEWRSDERHQQP